MNRIILTLICVFIFLGTNAQNLEIQFLSKYWKTTKEKKAFYFREIDKVNDTLFNISEYEYATKKLIMKGQYSSIKPMVENGYFEFYDDEDISIKSTGYYKKGLMIGKWTIYDSNSETFRTIDYNQNKIQSKLLNKKNKSDPILDIEEMPKFKNSSDPIAFSNYIGENLVYPPMAQKLGIEGKILLQFIIDEDGQLIDIEVLVGLNKNIDREAVRILAQSPDWTPGYKNGNPVKVHYVFPVSFKLIE